MATFNAVSPLLPIEDCCDAVARGDCSPSGIGIVPLVVMRQEVIERVGLGRLWFDLPQQKRSHWIAAHEAVEKSAYLTGAPNEFALNRGQKILLLVDGRENLFGGDRRLKGHCSPPYP